MTDNSPALISFVYPVISYILSSLLSFLLPTCHHVPPPPVLEKNCPCSILLFHLHPPFPKWFGTLELTWCEILNYLITYLSSHRSQNELGFEWFALLAKWHGVFRNSPLTLLLLVTDRSTWMPACICKPMPIIYERLQFACRHYFLSKAKPGFSTSYAFSPQSLKMGNLCLQHADCNRI